MCESERRLEGKRFSMERDRQPSRPHTVEEQEDRDGEEERHPWLDHIPNLGRQQREAPFKSCRVVHATRAPHLSRWHQSQRD